MRSHSKHSLMSTLVPTVLGLFLLLIVPVLSMRSIEILHSHIEEDLLPAYDAMHRTITRAHRLRIDTSVYPYMLDTMFATRYRQDKAHWLESTQAIPVDKLKGVDLTSWQAGVSDMRDWLQKYGDASIRDGELSGGTLGEPLFEKALQEMEAGLNNIARQEDAVRGQVREWEHGMIVTTAGLTFVCGLMVAFSWRNALALQEALGASSRNAERLEVAVKETNHRVKNNLQTIGALIDMNRQEYTQQVPRRVLDEIYQQVRTVAAVHDFLSHEHHANRVSVRPMLDKLVTLSAAAKEMRSEVYAAELELPVKEATSVALIVNELVLNAGKHGATCVHVHFDRDEDDCRLSVSDDGPGFPEGFQVATHGNLGTNLIVTLVQHDLSGTVRWQNGQELGGAEVSIVFHYPGALV